MDDANTSPSALPFRRSGSFRGVIDHVRIRVPDLDAARAFYRRTFELLDGPEPAEEGGFIEWTDFSITQESGERPATRGLHLGFRADSTRRVDDWWQAMIELGYPSAGEPGPRPSYGPDYYGGFIVDPAGNSVEAVNNGPRRQPGVIDHLWLRTRSLNRSSRFYEAVCPTVAHTVEHHPGRTQIRGSGATFAIVEGPPTEPPPRLRSPRQESGRRLPPSRPCCWLRLQRSPRRTPRIPPRLLRRLPARPR
jgi:catechol 2,3-dioxygenase-like lactoylglutathione lyase family enzyme